MNKLSRIQDGNFIPHTHTHTDTFLARRVSPAPDLAPLLDANRSPMNADLKHLVSKKAVNS